MAKTYLPPLFFLLLATAFPVTNLGQGKLHIGLKGGQNLSFARFDKHDVATALELKSTIGEQIGIALQFNLSDAAAVTSGFNIVRRGINTYHSHISHLQTKKYYSSIELPIEFSLRSHLTKRLYLRQRFGAAIQIIELSKDFQDGKTPVRPELYIIENSNRAFTGSLYAGLDFEIQTRKGFLFDFGATYHQGIGGYFKKAEVVYTSADTRNARSTVVSN